MIANVQRGETALSALTYIYDRAEQETGEPLRLIDGDCHGTPMWPNDKAALAAAVQVTDARKDARSQLDRPIMLCTIRSSPDLPPPTDEEGRVQPPGAGRCEPAQRRQPSGVPMGGPRSG